MFSANFGFYKMDFHPTDAYVEDIRDFFQGAIPEGNVLVYGMT